MSTTTQPSAWLSKLLDPASELREAFAFLRDVGRQGTCEHDDFFLFPTLRGAVAWNVLQPFELGVQAEWIARVGGRRVRVKPAEFRTIFTREDWVLGFWELPSTEGSREADGGESLASLYRLFLAGLQMRCLRNLLERAIHYSKRRRTFGVPLHQHQLVSNALVLGSTEYAQNRLYLLKLTDYPAEFGARELGFLSDSVLGTVDEVLPVFGAFGLTEEGGLNSLVHGMFHLAAVCQTTDGLEGRGPYGMDH